MVTTSDPFSVFAVTVIVFDTILEPLALYFTVNLADLPGAKGSLLQSSGTVHPHELLISVITKGAVPVLVYEKTVCTGTFFSISPNWPLTLPNIKIHSKYGF